MIHVVTRACVHLFEDEVLEFRRRDRERRGAYGMREAIDAAEHACGGFDRDSIYILSVADGQLEAGSRLTPSTGPHLLGNVFPHLASSGGVPREASVSEWTAVPAASPGLAHDHRNAGTMLCAVMEYCLAEGIYAVSSIIEASSLPRFHDMGWSPRPLGLPERIGEDWMLAVLMPIDVPSLEATRAFHGIGAPAVVRRSLQPLVTREIGL